MQWSPVVYIQIDSIAFSRVQIGREATAVPFLQPTFSCHSRTVLYRPLIFETARVPGSFDSCHPSLGIQSAVSAATHELPALNERFLALAQQPPGEEKRWASGHHRALRASAAFDIACPQRRAFT